MRGLVGSPPAPGRATCARLIGMSLLAFGCILLAGSLVGSSSALAQAQAADRIVTDPPRAAIRRPQAAAGPAALAAARGQVPPSHEAFLDLNIQYTRAAIYNPGTGKNDTVNLRSYRDAHETVPPKVPFVAPTIEIFPGETVRITLHNKLPAEPNCDAASHDVNIPHCFNTTNLHSHGLWVSPVGNSDNVLLSINPSVDFQYEYNVPPDHPAGTFWYHPHRHGSTALQVASGMAGVLIVKGTRLPTPQTHGDIDTLLQYADGTPVAERILLLQQIQYACRDADGKIKTKKENGKVVAWVCDPGDVGGIESYDQFGPPTWVQSDRYTSINGDVLPTFADAKAGRIERWRLVHAGVRDTIKLQFQKMRPGAPPLALLAAAQQDDWITQNCPGPALTQLALATDGITRGRIVTRQASVLQPGYREDLLMVFPEEGDYCVIDAAAPADSTVNNQAKSRKFLGKVTVGPGETVTDVKTYVQQRLIESAEKFMPPTVRQTVRDDLANDLRLASFVPHPDIAEKDVTGTQTLVLNINVNKTPTEFTIDGKPYDPNRIDRVLTLNGVDEWILTSNFVGHPFHIHVNPFQIVRIMDPQGKDVSVTGEPDDPQYADLKGVWKDTLFIKQPQPSPGHYIIVMRTRYQRYIGDFVLHCHILDHEDQGMMQNVRIAIPDGQGGVVGSIHH